MRFPKRLLIFTGDGKGKTTAALGMALRACGHNMRVLFLQFLKDDDSTGEIAAARAVPGLDIFQYGLGFVPQADDPVYMTHLLAARGALKKAKSALAHDDYQVVVLDEACTAISLGLIGEDDVFETLSLASHEVSLVMTGRGAPDWLMDMADTVTDMHCVKHGYTEGIRAEMGVEF